VFACKEHSVNDQRGRTAWALGSLLASLPREAQQAVLALGEPQQYNSGAVLFNQGEQSNFVLIIIDGYVKITAVSEDGAESLLAIRTAGDVIGELAAMDGLPRSATARAAGAVLARKISKAELERCLKVNYEIARAFSQAVSAKLRMATRRRVDFRKDTRSRLAQVLVDLYYGSSGMRQGGVPSILITQSELAGLIGASEPAVHKATRSLRAAGAIGTGYGRMVIEDIVTLRRIGEGNE
jgi:CRP/FNR family transcriptional regulator, cyclic AMP receptor protein